MKLERYSMEQLKKEILAIIGRHLDLSQYKVFVFGSRANGKARSRSDIDIGIEGSREIPKAIMGAMKEEIEEIPTLYKIDLVDFTQVSTGFRNLAKKHIEIIS